MSVVTLSTTRNVQTPGGVQLLAAPKRVLLRHAAKALLVDLAGVIEMMKSCWTCRHRIIICGADVLIELLNTNKLASQTTYTYSCLLSSINLPHNHSKVTLVQSYLRIKTQTDKFHTYFRHNRHQND